MRIWSVPEARLVFWGLLVNAVWELLQSPLFADHGRGLVYIVWTRLHCTGGDLLILLAAFWGTSILFRERFWWARPRWAAVVLFVLLGLVYTAWSEWYNTQVRHAWEYAAAMPLVFGLGLFPLLQWLLLPPVILGLVRRSRPAQRASRRRE